MSEEQGFPVKYEKVIKSMPEFKDTADSSDVETLKKMIVQCEGNIYSCEQDKAADVKLNAAKELVKDLGSGYRDAIKVQTAKIKYCLHLLESKGISVDNRDEEA